ncbi:hypothetical protein V491_08803, partial [Pseudogymnoascus sp. VKM F-3775]
MVTVPTWSSDLERKPGPQSAAMGNYGFDNSRTVADGQVAKNISIEIALNQNCGIESAAYALAIIRPDGQIETFLSDGLKTESKYLFTTSFQNQFLMASGRTPPTFKQELEENLDMDSNIITARILERTASSYRKRTPPHSRNAYDDES